MLPFFTHGKLQSATQQPRAECPDSRPPPVRASRLLKVAKLDDLKYQDSSCYRLSKFKTVVQTVCQSGVPVGAHAVQVAGKFPIAIRRGPKYVNKNFVEQSDTGKRVKVRCSNCMFFGASMVKTLFLAHHLKVAHSETTPNGTTKSSPRT